MPLLAYFASFFLIQVNVNLACFYTWGGCTPSSRKDDASRPLDFLAATFLGVGLRNSVRGSGSTNRCLGHTKTAFAATVFVIRVLNTAAATGDYNNMLFNMSDVPNTAAANAVSQTHRKKSGYKRNAGGQKLRKVSRTVAHRFDGWFDPTLRAQERSWRRRSLLDEEKGKMRPAPTPRRQ